MAMSAAARNPRYFLPVSACGGAARTRIKVAKYESGREIRRAWGIGSAGTAGLTDAVAMDAMLRRIFDECSRRLGYSPPASAPAAAPAGPPSQATPAELERAASPKALLALLAVAPRHAPESFVPPLRAALERLGRALVPAEAVALLEQASGRGASVTFAVVPCRARAAEHHTSRWRLLPRSHARSAPSLARPHWPHLMALRMELLGQVSHRRMWREAALPTVVSALRRAAGGLTLLADAAALAAGEEVWGRGAGEAVAGAVFTPGSSLDL